MSFIAAFPAVYRDSLANGKQHNGVHEWNKEQRRVAAWRGGAGRGPGIAQASHPLVSPLVTSFAGVGSGVIKRQAPRARGVQGHGRVRRRARGTQNDRASRGYSPIDPKNAAVSALVIARRKRAPGLLSLRQTGLGEKTKTNKSIACGDNDERC